VIYEGIEKTVPMMLSSATLSRLEKAAVDNGFDQDLPREDAWLGFASTQCPLRMWLSLLEGGAYCAALSKLNVANALEQYGTQYASPMPHGAVACLAVADIPALHRLVRRAFQLAKALPDELLHEFENQTAGLPRSTEVERLVIQRVGQDVFRSGLLEYWEGRCAITGLDIPALLCASHIKPWAKCRTDAERLDIFNGLLLAPHLDALFDKGFITVTDVGEIDISPRLSLEHRKILGLGSTFGLVRLADGHRRYLQHHRSAVFLLGYSE
jgi:putative restriction endonuclease